MALSHGCKLYAAHLQVGQNDPLADRVEVLSYFLYMQHNSIIIATLLYLFIYLFITCL